MNNIRRLIPIVIFLLVLFSGIYMYQKSTFNFSNISACTYTYRYKDDYTQQYKTDTVNIAQEDITTLVKIIRNQKFEYNPDYPNGYTSDYQICFIDSNEKKYTFYLRYPYGSGYIKNKTQYGFTTKLPSEDHDIFFEILQKYERHDNILLGG